MKKISLILFSLLMMFSFSVSVMAAGDSVHSIISGTNLPVKVSNKPNRYTGAGASTTVAGFRISFVTNDGTQISTYDYSNHKINNGYKIYVSTGTRNKATYFASGSSPSWTKRTSNNRSIGYSSISDFESKVNSNNFSLGVSVSSYIIESDEIDLEGFVKLLFKKSTHDDTNGDYSEDLKKVLKSFGVGDQYLTEEKIKTIFAVVEPTYLVLIGGDTYYYGTQYEIATVAVEYPYYKKNEYEDETTGETKTEYIKDESKHAFSNLTKIINHNGPCAAYLNGSWEEDLTGPNGKIAEKLGYVLPGFETGTYFGSIKMGTSAFKNVDGKCTGTGTFTETETISNLGIGMGIVWLYEDWQQETNAPTCEQVHSIAWNKAYNKNDLISCNDVLSIVDTFNNKVNTTHKEYSKITTAWYRNECGCQEQLTGYDCTPDYQTGMCSTSTQIIYDDVSSDETDFWNNCIYNSGDYTIDIHKTPSNSAYTYKDSGLTDNNRYCEVYCTENLETNFAIITSNTKYTAGYHITWPSGTTVTGSRTCKVKLTQSSWNTYQNELEDAVEDTIKYYNDYSEYKARYDILDDYYLSNENCDCKEPSRPTVTCYVIKETPTIEGGTIDTSSITLCSSLGLGNNASANGKYSSYSVTSVTSKDNEKITASVKETNPIVDDTTGNIIDNPDIPNTAEVTVTKYTYKLYKCLSWYKYYKTNGSTSGSYKYYYSSNYNQSNSGSLSSRTETFSYGSKICANEFPKNSVSSTKNEAYKDYMKAQSNANAYMQQMQKCYTWADESNKEKVYNLDPVLELSNVNTGYSIDSTLAKLDSSISQDLYSADELCTENEDYYYLCNSSGSSCEKKTLTVKNCVPQDDEISLVTATYTKKIRYSLNSGLYRYVYKENNLSVNTIPNNNNVNSYIYMPYGNIPIAYKTADGTYDISFTYSKLGHQDGTGTTAIDKIMEDIYANEYDDIPYGDWSCQYTITSDLIPEYSNNSGINVIYRPIDLNNPFPDIDGQGRKVGSNWCFGNDCSNTNYLVKQVITENPLPSEPMYSFILTPSVIQQIRKYNKNNSYSDFKLECEGETGKACVSEFLTGLIDGNLNNASFDAQAEGSCVYNPFARVNNSTYFYEC